MNSVFLYPWLNANHRLQHIISGDQDLLSFVRDGNEYICMNEKCSCHCDTVFDKSTNFRRYKNGFRMVLDNETIAHFNRSKFCKICDNLVYKNF